jgi:uncharacterized protein (TIGR02599 family)
MPLSPGTNPRAAAFTLVELMVSMTVLAIVVVMMSQMLITTQNAWSLGEANKERMQKARALSDFIGNELRAALLPINRTNTSNLQFVVNPASITAATFNNHDSMFWQAPLATDQTIGDVAEVGYFVQWDNSNAANPHSQLCRFFVNHGSGTTPDPNFLIYSSPAAWLSNATLQSVAPANRSNSYKGLFAENILGFWVQCLDPLGQPIVKDASGGAFTGDAFDSRRGYTYTDSTQTPSTIVVAACALPPIIALSVVTIDSGTASRIGATQKTAITTLVGSSANASAFVTSALSSSSLQAIRRGLRSYQTRIYLPESK